MSVNLLVILFIIYWKCFNIMGVILGMIVGFVLVIVFVVLSLNVWNFVVGKVIFVGEVLFLYMILGIILILFGFFVVYLGMVLFSKKEDEVKFDEILVKFNIGYGISDVFLY